mmetsp:Transcript_50829/g.110323  ORF Transcript_50829/g.110323 Transcript_50829/m.110323 type:complete len:201 (-) Transcript_50829:380-982(-)
MRSAYACESGCMCGDGHWSKMSFVVAISSAQKRSWSSSSSSESASGTLTAHSRRNHIWPSFSCVLVSRCERVQPASLSSLVSARMMPGFCLHSTTSRRSHAPVCIGAPLTSRGTALSMTPSPAAISPTALTSAAASPSTHTDMSIEKWPSRSTFFVPMTFPLCAKTVSESVCTNPGVWGPLACRSTVGRESGGIEQAYRT